MSRRRLAIFVAIPSLLLATSAVGATLWLSMWYFPGRATAEAVAPPLHQILPRGRTWAGSGPGYPYRRPRELPLMDASGRPSESWASLLHATSRDLAPRALLLTTGQLGVLVLVLGSYLALGRPLHVRAAARSAVAAAPGAFVLQTLFLAAPGAILLPAIGQLCWLTWWKFDEFDTFGTFATAGLSAARQGFPVSLGPFGVGGIWLGVIVAQLLLVGWAVRRALRHALEKNGTLAGRCLGCGYPRPAPTAACPECGRAPGEQGGTRRELAPGLWRLGSARSRWWWRLAAVGGVLVLLGWPLVSAWPGRFVPAEWIPVLPF